MLQRIQSIYLFLFSTCYFSYSYFGFEYYKKGYDLININFDFIFNLLHLLYSNSNKYDMFGVNFFIQKENFAN